MSQGDSDLQPAFIIAQRLSVSRQLVYAWTKRGKLEPAGEGADGRPLYSYRDAARVDRDARRSPQSHRRMPVAA